MANDESTLTSRWRRYSQVSTAVSGTAARYLGEKYFGLAMNREAHAENLRQLLGGLKGPLMKVAQFLSTVPGALPPEYAEEFLSLQSQAPAMGWAFVRRRMIGELGLQWESHFESFSREAAAAASLGQVHKARLKSGEVVACKLQYPDMSGAIEADLTQLNLFLSLYEKWSPGLRTDLLRQEIEERLREELDYRLEATHVKIFKEIFHDYPQIRLPQVCDALSTDRLLTLSWCEGKSVLSKEASSQEEKDQLCRLLFEAWYIPLYKYGFLHGDPHPGNYLVEEEGSISLLDLGCVRIFPGSFVEGVIYLYKALRDNQENRVVEAYEQWGFQNLTKDLINAMTRWARLLFEPLLDNKVRPILDKGAGQRGWETATQVHEALHQAGGLRPPREFVFMDRAAVGIGSVIMRLGGQQNWHQLFESLIEDFSPETLQARQDGLKSAFGPEKNTAV